MEKPKQLTVDETVEALKSAAKIIAELSETASTGACIFVAPNGTSFCQQMTPKACADIKGHYMGGPCNK